MKNSTVGQSTGLSPIGVRVTVKGMLFMAANAAGMLPRHRGRVDMKAFERFMDELNKLGFMGQVVAQAMEEMERLALIENDD